MLRGKRSLGFSMIELLTVIAVIGMLAAIGVPEFGRYSENQRIKTSAGNFQAALQTARIEAVRRNLPVQVVLTSSVPEDARVNDAVTNRAGPNWIIRAAKVNSTDYDFVEGFAMASISGRNSASVTIDGSRGTGLSIVEFTPTSRVAFNPPEAAPLTATPGQFNFANPTGGACATSDDPNNPMRCLRVVLSRTGQSRVCDPAVVSAGDPRKC